MVALNKFRIFLSNGYENQPHNCINFVLLFLFCGLADVCWLLIYIPEYVGMCIIYQSMPVCVLVKIPSLERSLKYIPIIFSFEKSSF